MNHNLHNSQKQILRSYIDRTSHHLVYFDTLRDDEDCRRNIESEAGNMLSSHAMKRSFITMLINLDSMFRKVSQKFFLWRLGIVDSALIVFSLDTMVMNHDEVEESHRSSRLCPQWSLKDYSVRNVNLLLIDFSADNSDQPPTLLAHS